MLIGDVMINWKPDYQEFQEVFSNENALRIIALLSVNKEQYCASDIAKLLDIHISTAKKYLDLFYDHGFLERRVFRKKAGKPTYFKSKVDQLTIILDMDSLVSSIVQSYDNTELPNPLIREKAYLDDKIGYEINTKGLVTEISVKKRTKAKRFVKQKVRLNSLESQFMKYLPHPTMAFEPFLRICEKAELKNYFEQKILLHFVEKLKKIGIIEEEQKIGEKNEC